MKSPNRTLLSFALLCLIQQSAHAHTGEAPVGGFLAGLLHPIHGWDHVLAMVAVGVWGSLLGARARWALPVVFPTVMAVGGAWGVLGGHLPAVEAGIAASSLVLGAFIAFAVRTPLWKAATVIAAFALLHGYAHGTELPRGMDPLAYSLGFVVGTGGLHLCGIAIGTPLRCKPGRSLVRAIGAAIALGGLGFLTGILHA